MRRSGRLAFGPALLGLLLFGLTGSIVSGSESVSPEIFFYPPPYRMADGRALNSPQTLSLQQITTDFPAIEEMSGVVLLVYWSTLCPEEDKCNFALIDDTIAYWRKRNKQVVLDVATIGFPIQIGQQNQSATPNWVLAKTKTYSVKTRLLGVRPDATADIVSVFPDFRDPSFAGLVRNLLLKLAKYDGNPTIAQIRIATGSMGEDNPIVGPLASPIPGYTERMWLSYCLKMTELYLSVFHKTELEFDIGRLSWMYALGDQADKKSVDDFVNFLGAKNIFLAFNGLESQDKAKLDGIGGRFKSDGIARSLYYARLLKRQGHRVGLEAIGLLTSPRMADPDAIGAAITDVKPDRLVFFSDFANVINFQRNGSNQTNESFVRAVSGAQMERLATTTKKLLCGPPVNRCLH